MGTMLAVLAGCAPLDVDSPSDAPDDTVTSAAEAPEVQIYEGQQGTATCLAQEALRDQLVPGGVFNCTMTDDVAGETFTLTLEVVDDGGRVRWQLDFPGEKGDGAWFREVSSGEGSCPPLTEWRSQISAGGSFFCGFNDGPTRANFGLVFTVVNEVGDLAWKFSP